MRHTAWFFSVILVLFPLAARAQQSGVGSTWSPPQKEADPLNPTQKLGQRIFQQRCGVCHTAPAPVFPMYGPALYKGLVEGNEDAVRQMIRDGSGKMPGFKHGMQDSEIDAIVEYLKTLPKPTKSTAGINAPKGPMD